MDFSYSIKAKVIFGRGKRKDLSEYAAAIGGKALLVTSLKGLPITNEIQSILQAGEVEFAVYDQVTPNPKMSMIDQAADVFDKEGCSFVIGFGGGSAIDFAKGVAVAAGHPGSVEDYLQANENRKEITTSTKKIIAVPTTAGTGTEVTPWGVITNDKIDRKTWVESENIIPTFSIVDPELSLGVPKRVTAGCGMDALAHAVESYLSFISTPITDLTSAEAIRLIARWLPEAVADGRNIVAREKMMYASMLAGMGILHAGAILTHGMGTVLGGRLDIPHGEAMSICLPPVLEYSWPGNLEKFAELSKMLGVNTEGMPLRDAAAAAAGAVRQLQKDIDLELTMSGDWGVKENQIDDFVDEVYDYLQCNVVTQPKKADKADTRRMFMEIL